MLKNLILSFFDIPTVQTHACGTIVLLGTRSAHLAR